MRLPRLQSGRRAASSGRSGRTPTPAPRPCRCLLVCAVRSCVAPPRLERWPMETSNIRSPFLRDFPFAVSNICAAEAGPQHGQGVHRPRAAAAGAQALRRRAALQGKPSPRLVAPQRRGERQHWCQHWKRWQGGWGWEPGFGGFGSGWCSAGAAQQPPLPAQGYAPMHPCPMLTRRRRRRLPACLQWSSKAFEVREPCTKIYNAARAVLSAIHDVKLE